MSRIIPLRFAKYAKVLHRLDARYTNIDAPPLSPEEVAVLNIPSCDVLRNFVTEKRSSGSRIFWRDAARILNVPYAPEIAHAWFSRSLRPHSECWPRFIYGPADGALSDIETRELASLLSAVTPDTQECYFKLAEVYALMTAQDPLYTGKLAEVQAFTTTQRDRYTPEYWWPANHKWCVCSDYDLTFTIVAGSETLIHSLLQSDVLECIEVDQDIRIDEYAPIPLHSSQQPER